MMIALLIVYSNMLIIEFFNYNIKLNLQTKWKRLLDQDSFTEPSTPRSFTSKVSCSSLVPTSCTTRTCSAPTRTASNSPHSCSLTPSQACSSPKPLTSVSLATTLLFSITPRSISTALRSISALDLSSSVAHRDNEEQSFSRLFDGLLLFTIKRESEEGTHTQLF